MSKIFEYLSVSDNDLGKTCCEKIEAGWEIEFVAPDRLAVFGFNSSQYEITSYKVLVSKEKTK